MQRLMESRAGQRAFTLIELLIVVAIIAILAAIAVPNFLEAQVRSKVARARADLRSLAVAAESYVTDYGQLFLDGDDPLSPALGLDFEAENGVKSDAVIPNNWGLPFGLEFRTYQAWKALTTPVGYVTSIPTDSFSRIMPYGYETAFDRTASKPSFALMTSLGPDRDMDGGLFGIDTVYDSTNGSRSSGDVHRLAGVSDPSSVKRQFGESFDFNP